jgi:hypothetical protein
LLDIGEDLGDPGQVVQLKSPPVDHAAVFSHTEMASVEIGHREVTL